MGLRGWFTVAGLCSLLLLPTVSHAGSSAHCYGPYTISATGTLPGDSGDDVRNWTGNVTTDLDLTAGALSVDVEGRLDGASAFKVIGTLTTSSLAQYHGPLDRLRITVTACSKTCSAGANAAAACTVASQCPGGSCTGCTATIKSCANASD